MGNADIEITQGEYGVAKVGKIRNDDLTDTYTSAKAYIWNDDDTLIIDGAICAVTFSDPDTHISWVPSSGDIDSDTTPGIYRMVFELLGDGVKSYVIEFTLEVLEGPPTS